MKYLLSSPNDNIYRHFLVPLLEKFDRLSTHIVKVLAATHLSHTETHIDFKLATFRTDVRYLLSPQDTYRHFLELLLPKFDTLSTHIKKALAPRSRVPADPPTHAPTTTLLHYYHPTLTKLPTPTHVMPVEIPTPLPSAVNLQSLLFLRTDILLLVLR
jgi:hypothetical protein